MSILIINGHPSPGSFCQQLADAYAAGAGAHTAVEVLNLHALDFDPILRGPDQPLEPDLLTAQRAITAAQHIVFVAPVWWTSLPALLKGFIDRTFLSGWAFRMKSNGMPEGLLVGRSARLIVTMDTPKAWYRLTWRTQMHRAFELGTLKFCGLGPRQRTLLFSVRNLNDSGRRKWLSQVQTQGHSDATRLADRAIAITA